MRNLSGSSGQMVQSVRIAVPPIASARSPGRGHARRSNSAAGAASSSAPRWGPCSKAAISRCTNGFRPAFCCWQREKESVRISCILRLGVTNKTALAMVQRLEMATRGLRDGPETPRRRVRWRAPATATATPREFGRALSDSDEDVPWAAPATGPTRQFQAFLETAREFGYDDDRDGFDAMLQRIAGAPASAPRRAAAASPSPDAPREASPGAVTDLRRRYG